MYLLDFIDTSTFVTFDMVTYSINENETPLEVCVSVEGNLQSSFISVSISTQLDNFPTASPGTSTGQIAAYSKKLMIIIFE